MKSGVFLGSLLASTIGLCALNAGEQSSPSTTDDFKKANQIREKLLASLSERCQKMLGAQVAVYDNTKSLHEVIQANADKKSRPNDKGISIELSDKQKAIITDVTKAIEMLGVEGAAVAFPEVFEEVRADMKRVHSRLQMSELGTDTQAIEEDIIETLKEMVRALTTSR